MAVSREEEWYPTIIRVICLYKLVVFKQNKEKGTLWIEYPGMWKDELASLLLCSVSMSVLCIKNLDQIPLLLITVVRSKDC